VHYENTHHYPQLNNQTDLLPGYRLQYHDGDEGKHLYAVTVRAAAKAFAAEIHRQGKTGGWDK
jgi:hypothetical protein